MSPDRGAHPAAPGPSLEAGGLEGRGLEVRDLVAVGSGGLVLGPVSLDVAPGTLTCVVGPAGAGKSLLLSALVGLVPGVRAAALTLGGAGLDEVRAEIGFAFQRDALLDHWTALENVAIALPRGSDDDDERHRRAQGALAAVGLAGAEHKRPPEMSGGMRRRVGLARALVRRPALLLLDDVTAGLDPSTAAEVLGRVLGVARERPAAVVLATADVDTALPRADQVMVLDEGRPVFLGRPAALSSSGPFGPFAPRSHGGGDLDERGAPC